MKKIRAGSDEKKRKRNVSAFDVRNFRFLVATEQY